MAASPLSPAYKGCVSQVWLQCWALDNAASVGQLWDVHRSSCLPAQLICYVPNHGCHGSMV